MPEKEIVHIASTKGYLIALLMILFSSSMRYVQALKTGEKIEFADMVAFIAVASSIVFSVLAGLMKLGYDIDLFASMILFWSGVISPFAYEKTVSGFQKAWEIMIERLLGKLK